MLWLLYMYFVLWACTCLCSPWLPSFQIETGECSDLRLCPPRRRVFTRAIMSTSSALVVYISLGQLDSWLCYLTDVYTPSDAAGRSRRPEKRYIIDKHSFLTALSSSNCINRIKKNFLLKEDSKTNLLNMKTGFGQTRIRVAYWRL